MPVPDHIYQLVRERAHFRCEYCHYPERLSTAPLSIDHLLPRSLGGTDQLDNLALACRRCLDLNDEHRAEPFIVKSRSMWIKAGLHPPADDPQAPC